MAHKDKRKSAIDPALLAETAQRKAEADRVEGILQMRCGAMDMGAAGDVAQEIAFKIVDRACDSHYNHCCEELAIQYTAEWAWAEMTAAVTASLVPREAPPPDTAWEHLGFGISTGPEPPSPVAAPLSALASCASAPGPAPVRPPLEKGEPKRRNTVPPSAAPAPVHVLTPRRSVTQNRMTALRVATKAASASTTPKRSTTPGGPHSAPSSPLAPASRPSAPPDHDPTWHPGPAPEPVGVERHARRTMLARPAPHQEADSGAASLRATRKAKLGQTALRQTATPPVLAATARGPPVLTTTQRPRKPVSRRPSVSESRASATPLGSSRQTGLLDHELSTATAHMEAEIKSMGRRQERCAMAHTAMQAQLQAASQPKPQGSSLAPKPPPKDGKGRPRPAVVVDAITCRVIPVVPPEEVGRRIAQRQEEAPRYAIDRTPPKPAPEPKRKKSVGAPPKKDKSPRRPSNSAQFIVHSATTQTMAPKPIPPTGGVTIRDAEGQRAAPLPLPSTAVSRRNFVAKSELTIPLADVVVPAVPPIVGATGSFTTPTKAPPTGPGLSPRNAPLPLTARPQPPASPTDGSVTARPRLGMGAPASPTAKVPLAPTKPLKGLSSRSRR